MPKVAVRFSESAVTDLEAIRNWYALEGVPDVGDRFVDEILGDVEALRDHPEIGRIVPEFNRPFLRELIRPPFRIVYRRDPNCVRIVRVWRSAQLLVLAKDD
jgi:plasmid stabilization system protein ParE